MSTKVKKTNMEKLRTMFLSGKKFKIDGICKKLYGEVNLQTKNRVYAAISKINAKGDTYVELVSEGTYQAK